MQRRIREDYRMLTHLHSYLQNVILDSYVYATDSLLQELSLSHSSSTMVKLSLKGCDVITDSGICCLEGKLQRADKTRLTQCDTYRPKELGVSGCEQLQGY